MDVLSGGSGPEGVVCPATLLAWSKLAGCGSAHLYLAGDTALAVQLRHRESVGLEFLYHDDSVDIDELIGELADIEPFAITDARPGLLRGDFSGTTLEVRHADEHRRQTLLEAPILIGGLRVAAVADLIALKLYNIPRERLLGDYFDLMTVEQTLGISIEDGVRLFLERFGLAPGSAELIRLVNALGYFDGVPDDPTLPVDRQAIAGWWVRRQVRLVRSLAQMA